MTLTVILGDVGAGKTLLSTILSFYTEGDIYANYEIKHEKYKPIEPKDLIKVKGKCLVIIDEAYAWIESRTSGKDINRYFSYILFQSRKRGMDWVLTSQLLSPVDLRFRHMANYFILAESQTNGFVYKIQKISSKRFLPKKLFLPFEKAEQFFNKYDTFELINPIDEKMLASISETPQDFNNKIDEIVRLLKNKFKYREKFTIPFIRDFLVRNNYSLKYAQYVHTRINLKEQTL